MKKTQKHTKPILKRKNWVAPTMAAASGVTGLPLEAIKEAKRVGCSAFAQNGNVNCQVLIKFLSGHPEILERAGLGVNREIEEGLTARAERQLVEHRLKIAEGKVLPLDQVRRDGTRFAMELKTKAFALPKRLGQVFALETDPVTIEQRLRLELTEVFADVSKNPWSDFVCPTCKAKIQP